MRIITTSAIDFIRQEIDEWGFDYVEQKFDEGFEPTFINGVWCWHVPVQFFRSIYAGSNTSGSNIPSMRDNMGLLGTNLV